MSEDAGTLKGYLKLDDADFKAAIKRARAAMRKLGAASIAMGAAAVTAMGVQAVASAAKLEQAIVNAAAVTRDGQAAFDGFKAAALDASKSAAQSATEMGNALLYLGRSGMETVDVMAALPQVAALATASMTELGKATDIATDVMTAFGKNAMDLAHIGDVLLLATNRTNTSFEQMGEAMKYAAPTARALGQSLETTAAAMGLMANAGIKGSQAGTTLRMALLRLAKPTRMSRKALKDLGLSVTDSQGKMRKFGDIISQLEDAQKRYGTQSTKFAGDIARVFGTEAMSGIMSMVEQGSGALETLRRELKASAGTTKMLEAQMISTLSGQMKVAKGNIENLAAVVGDQMTPYAKAFAMALSKLAGRWTENASGANKLRDAIKGFATILSASLKAMAVAVKVLGVFAKAWIFVKAPAENFGRVVFVVIAGVMALKEAMSGNMRAARIWRDEMVSAGKEATQMWSRMGDDMDEVNALSDELASAADLLAKSLDGVNVELFEQEKQIAKTQREFNKLMKSYREGGILELGARASEGDKHGGSIPLADGQRANHAPGQDNRDVVGRVVKGIRKEQSAASKRRADEAKRRAENAKRRASERRKAAQSAAAEARRRIQSLKATFQLEISLAKEKDAIARAEIQRTIALKKLSFERLVPAQKELRLLQIKLTYQKAIITAKEGREAAAEAKIIKGLEKEAELVKQQLKDQRSLNRSRQDRANSQIKDPRKRAHAEHAATQRGIDQATGMTDTKRTQMTEEAQNKLDDTTKQIDKESGAALMGKVQDIYGKVKNTLSMYSDAIGKIFGKGTQDLLEAIGGSVDASITAFTTEFSKSQNAKSSAMMAVGAGLENLASSAQKMFLEHERTQQHFRVVNQALKDLGMGDVLGEFIGAMEPAIGLFITITQALKPLFNLAPKFNLMDAIARDFFVGTKKFIGGVLSVARSIISASNMVTGIAVTITAAVYKTAQWFAGWASKFGVSLDTSKLKAAVKKASSAHESTGAALDAIKNAQNELNKATMESSQAVYDETKLRAELNKQLSEGVRNGPAGYKMAWARFESTQRAGSQSMSMAARQAASTTNIQTVIVMAQDVEHFEQQMRMKSYQQTGSTSLQQSGAVQMSVSRING